MGLNLVLALNSCNVRMLYMVVEGNVRLYLYVSLLTLVSSLCAAELSGDARVALIEDDSAECLANDGKLIRLKSDARKTIVVWLDRWFMGVQTADHTKHVMQSEDEPIALGCSVTRDGEKQHWTIASVR